MELVLQRWSTQACLILGRRLAEPVPEGSTVGRVILGRFADVEYCADDGGDTKVRYLPGVSPLVRDFESSGPEAELIAGTLELSADVETGCNAFKRFDPYPRKLLTDQEKGIAAFEEMFDDMIEQLALDSEAGWYLVAGAAFEAHLFYGAMLKPSQAESLPDRALQTMLGEAPGHSPHERVVVGARIATVDAEQRFVRIDASKLDPRRYDAVTRVIRNFAANAKLGFVVVPTSKTTERELYEEAFGNDG